MSDQPSAAPAAAPACVEDVEVWWGSCSPWTLLPGFVASLVVTGLIAWATWWFLPREVFRPAFFSLAAVLWTVQLLRWAYRLVTSNYRLTMHRLFVERGLARARTASVNLAEVAHVSVVRTGLDRMLGVGRIRVQSEDGRCPLLLMDGVRDPGRIAELLRHGIEKARERAAAGQPTCG